MNIIIVKGLCPLLVEITKKEERRRKGEKEGGGGRGRERGGEGRRGRGRKKSQYSRKLKQEDHSFESSLGNLAT